MSNKFDFELDENSEVKEQGYITGNKKMDEDFKESEDSSDGHMSGDETNIDLKTVKSIAASKKYDEQHLIEKQRKLEDLTVSARSSNKSNSSAVSNSDNRASKINNIQNEASHPSMLNLGNDNTNSNSNSSNNNTKFNAHSQINLDFANQKENIESKENKYADFDSKIDPNLVNLNKGGKVNNFKLITQVHALTSFFNHSDFKNSMAQINKNQSTFFKEATMNQFGTGTISGVIQQLLEFKQIQEQWIEKETFMSYVQIDALRKIKFNPDNEIHIRVVQSVQVKVTGEQNPPSLGSDKWLDFGFQNAALATDFRDNGLFPMILILASLKFGGFKDRSIIKEFHEMCQQQDNKIPFYGLINEFALMAWNLTKTINGIGVANMTGLLSLLNKLVLGQVIIWMRLFKNRDMNENPRMSDPETGVIFSLGHVKQKAVEFVNADIKIPVNEFKNWFKDATIQTNIVSKNNMV